jgi:hypothetical protein
MIETDIAGVIAAHSRRGEAVIGRHETEVYVVCDELAARLGDNGVHELASILAPLNIEVTTESEERGLHDAPAQGRPTEFCFFVEWNTPIWARIGYGEPSGWRTTHRAWFIFGRWFSGPAVSSWSALRPAEQRTSARLRPAYDQERSAGREDTCDERL